MGVGGYLLVLRPAQVPEDEPEPAPLVLPAASQPTMRYAKVLLSELSIGTNQLDSNVNLIKLAAFGPVAEWTENKEFEYGGWRFRVSYEWGSGDIGSEEGEGPWLRIEYRKPDNTWGDFRHIYYSTGAGYNIFSYGDSLFVIGLHGESHNPYSTPLAIIYTKDLSSAERGFNGPPTAFIAYQKKLYLQVDKGFCLVLLDEKGCAPIFYEITRDAEVYSAISDFSGFYQGKVDEIDERNDKSESAMILRTLYAIMAGDYIDGVQKYENFFGTSTLPVSYQKSGYLSYIGYKTWEDVNKIIQLKAKKVKFKRY